MTREVSYTHARDNLASLMDHVIADHEIVKIHRRTNGVNQDVAIIAADELESLLETAHLLRSPKNAERLFAALERTEAQTLDITSVEDLRREMGLDSLEVKNKTAEETQTSLASEVATGTVRGHEKV